MSSIPGIPEEPSEEQTMKTILQAIRAGDAESVSAGGRSGAHGNVEDVLRVCVWL